MILRGTDYQGWVRSVKNYFGTKLKPPERHGAARVMGILTVSHTVKIARRVQGYQAEKFIPEIAAA